jgi:UDP-N-acetyl-D-mannosaminuronic acid transferase (WecB/TagA/CpsF family)
MHSELVGLKLPQIQKKELYTKISNFTSENKVNLIFLYSEYIVRMSRNISYQEVIQSSELFAIDGRGLEWSNWAIQSKTIRKFIFKFLPSFLNYIIILVINFFSGLFVIVSKFNTQKLTHNEVILGREFAYDLINICINNNWRLLIVGGNQELIKCLKDCYPKLKFEVWITDPDSLLMKDIGEKTSRLEKLRDNHIFLTKENLYEEFSELRLIEEYLINNKFDIIQVCIGGASGKQEFLLDRIKNNPQISYRLATGLGAAFDHLGANTSQPVANKLFLNFGLEWLFRLIHLPKRRKRIIDSVLNLWILTSRQIIVNNTK